MAREVVLEQTPEMGRKKSDRKTTMVRVFEEFAEKIKKVSGERGMTAAEFCEKFLEPCVDRAHREYIEAEAKKLKGGK